MALIVPRSAIVREALSWRGTPYRHQASVKHGGCDCLGLVRGVWRALIGPEPARIPAYAPDWAEAGETEALRAACARWLSEVPLEEARPGDVLLFRMAPHAPAKHAAILTAPDKIAHAYWGRAVVESHVTAFWRSKRAAAFSFPGVVDG